MSLTFSVSDSRERLYTHRIVDLCQYLGARVLQPFFARHQIAWNYHSTEFIHPVPGVSPFEPTGTVCFVVPPMFAGQLGELETLLRAELDARSIRTGLWCRELTEDGLHVRQIQIPVVDNPTAQHGPPEVNMSNAAGCLVLRDLLGYRQCQGRYEFTAEDVLARLQTISESHILKCSTRTVRDPKTPGRLRVTQSPATAQRIQRCLDEVRRFAEWARQRHLHHLRAS